jgi:hypothetical protein
MQTKVVDIVISYLCASGLAPGLWLEWLQHFWVQAAPGDYIIQGQTGAQWTSNYYRQNHLYRWLGQQRAEGDPFLQAFTDMLGNRLEDKYYSFGTYWRGG